MGAREQSRWGNCFKLSITLKSLKGFKNVLCFFLAFARVERFRDLEKIENHCHWCLPVVLCILVLPCRTALPSLSVKFSPTLEPNSMLKSSWPFISLVRWPLSIQTVWPLWWSSRSPGGGGLRRIRSRICQFSISTFVNQCCHLVICLDIYDNYICHRHLRLSICLRFFLDPFKAIFSLHFLESETGQLRKTVIHHCFTRSD